jgi:hypothetical protein
VTAVLAVLCTVETVREHRAAPALSR